MAEIIDFADAQAERRRSRASTQHDLQRAVDVLKSSLAVAAQALAEAHGTEQPELLTRVERLSALIRYGLRMLGHSDDPGLDRPSFHFPA